MDLTEIQNRIHEVENLMAENKEDQAWLKQNYDQAREQLGKAWIELYDQKNKLRREYDKLYYEATGKSKCSKCGGYLDEPGRMTSDDSYSRFQCPFHPN